jgi:hypothetical protein
VENLTTINQLKSQFKIEGFVEKTIKQINKDLASYSNQSIAQDCETNSLTLLMKELTPIIKELFAENNLEQFTYRVDLNEKKWIYFTQGFDFEYLCEQIIIREAQKVYLREMFSSKG